MNELDRIIFDEIRKLKIDENFRATISRAEPVTDESQLIRERLDTIKSQRSRFLDLYGLGSISADEIDTKLAPLAEETQRLEARLLELQNKAPKLTDHEAMKLVQSFDDALNRGNFAELRMILTALINRIDIDGDDITISWKFA